MTVVQAIPDVNVFLALEPEELGAKWLLNNNLYKTS
jgi:hypothetical protein